MAGKVRSCSAVTAFMVRQFQGLGGLGFEVVDFGEGGFDVAGDFALFGKGWNRYREARKPVFADMLDVHAL